MVIILKFETKSKTFFEEKVVAILFGIITTDGCCYHKWYKGIRKAPRPKIKDPGAPLGEKSPHIATVSLKALDYAVAPSPLKWGYRQSVAKKDKNDEAVFADFPPRLDNRGMWRLGGLR